MFPAYLLKAAEAHQDSVLMDPVIIIIGLFVGSALIFTNQIDKKLWLRLPVQVFYSSV